MARTLFKKARRFLGVGDDSRGTPSSVLSALGTTPAALQAAMAKLGGQCAGQNLVRGTGTTDLACGFLRGWQRIFLRNGSSETIDPRSQGGQVVPVGAPPTAAEWQAFDAQAKAAGVGGLTAQLKAQATPSQSFRAQFSRAVSQTGRGLQAGQLDKAAKGVSAGLGVVAAPVNAIVPGAGTVLENALLAVVAPGLLPTTIAGVSVSGVPFAGAIEDTAGAFVAPANPIVTGPTAGAQAVGQTASPLQALFDAAGETARDAGSLKGTLAQAVDIATGPGSGRSKLERAALEGVAELSFAVSVVGIVLTGGTLSAADATALNAAELTLAQAEEAGDAAAIADAAAELSSVSASLAAGLSADATAGAAVSVLSLSLTAIRAGVTVANAVQAAAALKSAAAKAQAKAKSDEQLLDAQIAALEARIKQTLAETKALRGETKVPAGQSSPSGVSTIGLLLLALLGARAVLA